MSTVNHKKQMKTYIDVTVPISPTMPIWPDSAPPQFVRRLDISKGDVATDTDLRFSAHTGTHIDAPSHFMENGKSIDDLDLRTFMGPVYVANISDAKAITSSILDKLVLPGDIERLLLRTSNSDLWASDTRAFQKSYVALTADAAKWVVDKGIKLIGIDYLSIQRFTDGPETHQILLRGEVAILEGLNLSAVKAGLYKLMALPLKLTGVEASPVRAVLFEER